MSRLSVFILLTSHKNNKLKIKNAYFTYLFLIKIYIKIYIKVMKYQKYRYKNKYL